MDNYKFITIVKFFYDELGCNVRVARKLAGYVDNIVFNARMENNDDFISIVAFGVRNAYLAGEQNAKIMC